MNEEIVREMCEGIVREVVDRVGPAAMVARAWPRVEEMLSDTSGCGIDVVGIGKASAGLAEAVLEMLEVGVGCQVGVQGGGRIARGIVLTPSARGLRRDGRARIEVVEVDHPSPTERNASATARVERFVREGASRGKGRTLLVLVSGGGSAHLVSPADGLSVGDVAAVSMRMMRAGGTIDELNSVRKHVERLKGGGLARLASGYSRVVSLVVSDVMGDDLSVIASGPLAPDPTTYTDALEAMRERGVSREDAPAVWAHLERGVRGEIAETAKPGEPCFDRVRQRIIGSNADAMRAAEEAIMGRGVRVLSVRGGVVGEAADRGQEMVVEMARGAASDGAMGVVWGGETTVTVGDRSGVGGRNQEFVLAAARAMAGRADALVLAFGTDGIDGVTDAAGAWATGETWERIRVAGVDAEVALREHDSHRALGASGSLIRTGPTGTNVNDVMVAIMGGMALPEGGVR
ncbi:MAG: DUF4147 domain-containing protein [Phycisphaeraceae bacterium]|nr:DUF4147 domain-containing protein [Phycisphaeraceae bacterium]